MKGEKVKLTDTRHHLRIENRTPRRSPDRDDLSTLRQRRKASTCAKD